MDGSSYEGMWAEGMRNGIGTLKTPDGDEYDGEWLALTQPLPLPLPLTLTLTPTLPLPLPLPLLLPLPLPR